jgi:hypothetical protein
MTTTGENIQGDAALAEQSNPIEANQSQNQGQQVPVHVVQAMREEMKALKEQNQAFSNHLEMLRWQQSQAHQPAPQPVSPFGNADPEDSIKVKDAVKMYQDFNQQIQMNMAELKIASKHSDYQEMIQKYLPKATQEDPDLLEEIKRSPNPYKTAYLAAKASNAFREDTMSSYRATPTQTAVAPQKTTTDVDKMINNARQSGNLSSVANNASPQGQHPEFSSLSDEEFRQYKSKVRYGRKH